MLIKIPGSLGAIGDREFLEDVLQMKFYGALAEVQRFGDLWVAQPLTHDGEHLPFPD